MKRRVVAKLIIAYMGADNLFQLGGREMENLQQFTS